jgi:thioredoxin 1
MSEIIVLSSANYDEVTGSGVVAVDFYADWCGPCKMMAPIFDEAKDAYDGKATFAKINVDDNKEIAMTNKVMGIPTLLFFKDGQQVDRVTGVIDKGALYAKLDALV